MKIHADKIVGGPPHAISVRDVRRIIANVPPDWIDGLREVRIANSQYGPKAFVSRSDGLLTIYSRYGTKKEILFAVLAVLAAPTLNIKSTVAHSPSKAEQNKLEQFTKPFIDRILPVMTAPKKLSPEAHVPFKVIPFPNDASSSL